MKSSQSDFSDLSRIGLKTKGLDNETDKIYVAWRPIFTDFTFQYNVTAECAG